MAYTPKKKSSSRASAPGSRKRTSTRKNASNTPKVIFYGALLAIGAAAIIFYTPTGSRLMHSQFAASTQTPIENKSKPKSHFVEPDYQFYTMLPSGDQKTSATHEAKPQSTVAAVQQSPAAKQANSSVASPVVSEAKKAPAPIVALTPTPNKQYALQLAAFRHYEDADELKAKLVLQGYTTSIHSASVNGSTWYRLWVGPYASEKAAKTAQTNLAQNHLAPNARIVTE